MSDDGRSTLVLIMLLGNVFSPRWSAARARGLGASSLDYSAVNLAIHGSRGSCWAMTERPAHRVARSADHLAIGDSRVAWEGDTFVAQVDERSAPFGGRVRGTIRFRPESNVAAPVQLDERGRHLWQPIAPLGTVEVDFSEPRVRFRGHGYLDHNAGAEPLEDAFDEWTWSRVGGPRGVSIAYDVRLRGGGTRSRGLRIDPRGDVLPKLAAPRDVLPSTRFGLAREVQRHEGRPVSLVRTLEDGPFYARSLVRAEGVRAEGVSAPGHDGVVHGIHETVSLERFRKPWVRFLVPFRMRVEAR